MKLLSNYKLATNISKEDMDDTTIDKLQSNIDSYLEKFKHILSIKLFDYYDEYYTISCEPFKAVLDEFEMNILLDILYIWFDNLSIIYNDMGLEDFTIELKQEQYGY